MRVGINARFLASKRTGVQRAAYNLIKALVKVDRTNEYFLFAPEYEGDNPDWHFENVTVVGARISHGESIRNHIWEQFTLPRLANEYAVDFLHSPANLAPLLYRGKSIVHIHDLCFVVNPQWYSFTIRTLYNFIIPRLARRASKVTTNSNNSRNDLLQFCNVPAGKVSQVYWAVDDLFMQDNKDAQSNDFPFEHSDYVLSVGSIEPRKNIRLLLEAYEILRTAYPAIKTKLVLIGGESPLFAEVRLNIKQYKKDIVFKGFVNDDVLKDYYRHASLFVYPSLYEGFGLPPLEAMASGVPVVTSLTSSIPEVVGDAALMVSPHDANQLAEAMARILLNKELQGQMVKKGLEQVKKFNWYRVARHTLAVYHEVYNQGNRASAGNHFLPIELWKELKEIENSKMRQLSRVASTP